MRSRSALLAALLAVCAAPAQADFASEALLHDFVRTIDASADWTASASVVRSEDDDTIAEGLVFSRQAPAVSVSIERLRLNELAEEDEGGFSASEIEMTGAGLVSDEANIWIPAASVRDLSIPSTEGLVYDPAHLMAFIGRLYSVMAESEFTEFSVPELNVTPRRPAPGTDAAAGPDDSGDVEGTIV